MQHQMSIVLMLRNIVLDISAILSTDYYDRTHHLIIKPTQFMLIGCEIRQFLQFHFFIVGIHCIWSLMAPFQRAVGSLEVFLV